MLARLKKRLMRGKQVISLTTVPPPNLITIRTEGLFANNQPKETK